MRQHDHVEGAHAVRRAASRRTFASGGPPSTSMRRARRLEERRVALADVEEGGGEVRRRGAACAPPPRAIATRGESAPPAAPRPRPGDAGRETSRRPPPNQRVRGDEPGGRADLELPHGAAAALALQWATRAHVREQVGVSALSSSAGTSETCAGREPSIPIHITGAIAGSATTFATRLTSETRPKWNDISGAVASVAATVIAAPAASGSGSRRQHCGQRPGRAEDPGDSGEAELPADVQPCARIDRERDGGGEQQRVPA